MGNACVALNQLGCYSQSLELANSAYELLKSSGPPNLQMVAMLNNRSVCNEYLGNPGKALEAAEKGIELASRLNLPETDPLLLSLQSAKSTQVNQTNTRAHALIMPTSMSLCMHVQ